MNSTVANGQGGQPYAPSHPSRRDNQSISSTTSRGSDRDRERTRTNANLPVESAVTRLLVAIKQLLEALTLWSTQKMSEAEVSDVYVRLGNDFNAAVAAFRSFNIDLSELLSVPDDLRSVLETCLSEDATPSNLEIYLPTVRQIITSLLQGLRSKQSIYRRIMTDRKQHTSESRASNRESRATRSSRADSISSSGSRLQQTRSVTGGEYSSNRSSAADGQQRRIVSSSRRSEVASPPPVPPPADDYFPGGFSRPKTPTSEEGRSIGHRRERSRATDSFNSGPSSENQDRLSTPRLSLTSEDPNDTTITLESSNTSTQAPAQVTTVVPASVTRYSLSDPPVPAVVVDGAIMQPSDSTSSTSLDRQSSVASVASTATETPPDTPPIDAAQAPAFANSLAALKESDTLERRASKRFSTYNISKMTGTGMKERPGPGRGINRRSMAADSSSLTPGELNVLTEEDESGSDTRQSLQSGTDYFTTRSARTPSPSNENVPPLPSLPTKSPSGSDDTLKGKGKEQSSSGKAGKAGPEETKSNLLTVFLQVGREVKKVSIDRGLSFSSLRVLFVDKFSYSPGQGNFPDIYIRDPSSGVMYELEDVEEVKDKCLLSLNIDPLDQIKQHIDSQMSELTQELKELRSSVGSSKRISQIPPQQPIIAQPFTEIEAQVNRPSDKQFQRIARRLSRLVTTPEEPPRSVQTNGILAQATGSTIQSQWTGGSILSEVSSRIVSDLKTQFDEVQNLRRDLGVMRQMYVDFMSQTKESLGALRSQAQAVRQLSNSKVAGARAYVNAGKASLDQRTQTVLTRVEELQDTVETLKDDVLKRNMSPRSNVVKTVVKDISEVAAELDSLKEYMCTVKPMWKKTWEEELQNIVEEQQFLTHQEELLQDLLEDRKALVDVFSHVEKVITLRGSGAGRTKQFKPVLQDEGHGGISTVMMEIRNAATDPERRLKAIAANQKSRERERSNTTDEFESELKGYVSGKKLKMTGGAEEIERVRQKRNDLALKAMFNNSQNGASTSGAITPTSATFSEHFNSEGSSSPQS